MMVTDARRCYQSISRMVNMTDRSAAPGPLEQVRTFLNTWSIPNDTRVPIDDLDGLITDPERWQDALPDVPLPATADRSAALAQLTALRDGMRAALGTTHPTCLEAAIDAHRWRVRVCPPGSAPALQVVPEDRTSAAVLLSFAIAAISAGIWHRLRACPDCGWVFYDSSRNARRTWCSMTAAGGARGCGSIAKTRAYRARQR